MDECMTFDQIPAAIQTEVLRMQREEFDWPKLVPRFVEQRIDGREFWHRYVNTSVSDCEQITEYHSRQAEVAIRRYLC